MAARTSEIQHWSIKKEGGQGPDQVRPLRLDTIYHLVTGKASPLLTIEVNITGKHYQAPLSEIGALTMRGQRPTEEIHQAT